MIPRHYFLGLRNQQPELYHGLNVVVDYVEALAAAAGIEPMPAPQVAAGASSPPPAEASGFEVSGEDGHYQITISNNASNPQPVQHEIASATSLNFDAASETAVFGPEARTQWTIPDPGATKFWRLRSKLQTSGFNAPQYFHAASSGAPVAVASGVLRSVATAARTQRTANYITVTAEYSASGAALANGDTSDGTPTVDWAAGNVSMDGGTTLIAVPKTTLRGVGAGASYVLAWDTAANMARYTTDGGQALADGEIYLATVVLPSALNGAASSAGGGPNAIGVAANGGRYSYT